MPLTHTSLITLLDNLHYPTDDGMCFGYAVMGMQAMLANDFSTFSKRLQYINNQLETKEDGGKEFATYLRRGMKVQRRESLNQYRKDLLEALNREDMLGELQSVEASGRALEPSWRLYMTIPEEQEFEKEFEQEFSAFLKKFDALLVKEKKDQAAIEAYHAQCKQVGEQVAKTAREDLLKALNKNVAISDEEFDALLKKAEKDHAAIKAYNVSRGHIDDQFPKEALEAQAFLEDLALYYSPEKFSKLFPEGAAPYGQDVARTFIRGLPKELEHKENKEESLVKKIDLSLGSYNIEELTQYFQALDPLSQFNPPIGLLIGSGNHGISVSYDTEHKCWRLFDINELPNTLSYEKPEDLAKGVFSAISCVDSPSPDVRVLFRTEVYCRENQVEAVSAQLSEITKQNTWQNIHNNVKKFKDVDSFGYSLLHLAARKGDVAYVSECLADETDKYDPNTPNTYSKWTPLIEAVNAGQLEVVKVLLADERVDPTQAELKHGRTPLMMAVISGHLEVMKALLVDKRVDKRVDPRVPNDEGHTPLVVAVFQGNVEAVKILLADERVDPRLPNKLGGYTPLAPAIGLGHLEVVKVLLLKMMQLDLEDQKTLSQKTLNQKTPLNYAVSIRNAAAVRVLLLDKSMNPNEANDDGDTPLHLAVRNKDVEIVKALLENEKVNPNQTNKLGETPLHLAKKNPEIMAIINKRSGSQTEPTLEQNSEGVAVEVETKVDVDKAPTPTPPTSSPAPAEASPAEVAAPLQHARRVPLASRRRATQPTASASASAPSEVAAAPAPAAEATPAEAAPPTSSPAPAEAEAEVAAPLQHARRAPLASRRRATQSTASASAPSEVAPAPAAEAAPAAVPAAAPAPEAAPLQQIPRRPHLAARRAPPPLGSVSGVRQAFFTHIPPRVDQEPSPTQEKTSTGPGGDVK